MRRAFDGTEIQQKPQPQQQQAPQYGKQHGQPPLHPMRPASAKPPAYNNLMQNNIDQEEPSHYQQLNHSSQNYSENNINSNRVYYQNQQQQQQQQPRQVSGGMQRNNSAQRNYESNIMQLNKTAQQLNKINSQLNTSGVEPYGGDVAKHMPRIISQDKEQLYAETLTLKNQINLLKEGNKTLKTQLYQSERDSVKYKKIVDQYEANGVIKGFYPKTEGGHITENLKRTVKDLKLQLAAKEEESNKVKKTIKFTRIQELDIERKSYAEECSRLKTLLQQALNEKMEILIKETDYQKLEERFYALSNEAEQLRYDNREMAQQLKNYDNQNNFLQRGYNDLERKSNLQITTLRKHLKERDREINELKNELGKVRLQNSNNNSSKKDFSNQLPVSSNRLARPQSAKNTETGFLKKQLEMKDDRIRQLEEDVIQLRHELTTQGNQGPDDYDDDDKAQNSTYRNNQNQNTYNNGSIQQQHPTPNEDKNQQQINANGSKNPEIKIEQHSQYQQNNQELSKKASNQIEKPDDKKSIEGVLKINSDSNGQPVSKIRKEDVAHIGEELQYKLRSHALNLSEAAQLFFDNLDDKTSIRDLQAMLLDKPFNLQQNDALLLSRFLVEDKEGKYKFDWEYARKNESIFQSFNDIVGPYQVFSKGYAQKLYNYLSEIFINNRESIKATLQTKSNGKNTISKDQFIQTFEFLNIKLQKDQVAFLIMTMIQESVDLNHLYYKNLLKLFKLKPNQYADEDGEYEQQGEYDEQDEEEEGYEDDDYQEAEKYINQNQHSQQSNNQVKLQRPQSSKRRNPLPNNQLEDGNDEYYDQSGQGIDEDNDGDDAQYYEDDDEGYGQYELPNKNLNQDRSLNKEEESIIKKYADRKSSHEYEGKMKGQNQTTNHLTPQQYDEILKQKEKDLLKSWRDEEDEEIEQSQPNKYGNNQHKQHAEEDEFEQYVEEEFEKNHSKQSKELPKQKSSATKKTKGSNKKSQKVEEEEFYEDDFDDKSKTKQGSKIDNKSKGKKTSSQYEDDFDEF